MKTWWDSADSVDVFELLLLANVDSDIIFLKILYR